MLRNRNVFLNDFFSADGGNGGVLNPPRIDTGGEIIDPLQNPPPSPLDNPQEITPTLTTEITTDETIDEDTVTTLPVETGTEDNILDRDDTNVGMPSDDDDADADVAEKE